MSLTSLSVNVLGSNLNIVEYKYKKEGSTFINKTR